MCAKIYGLSFPLPCRYTVLLPRRLPVRTLALLLTCWLIRPFSASAWWQTGHEAVARLAAAHLTPAARTRVAQILQVPDTDEAVADGLAEASIWADHAKNEKKTAAWHYIDLALQDRKTDIPKRCENDNCVTARIRLFAAQLSAKTTPQDSHWSDLDALRFVVHFVGDVHQPLHSISDADQGGNCERLDPPVGRANNVHALWDGEIVNSIGKGNKALAADLDRQVRKLSPARQRILAEGGANDWAWESHVLAHKVIYKRLHIPEEPVGFPAHCSEAPAALTAHAWHIPPGYVKAMQPILRAQLEKAGLRLARLLNESL
jgi:hypothetical protein